MYLTTTIDAVGMLWDEYQKRHWNELCGKSLAELQQVYKIFEDNLDKFLNLSLGKAIVEKDVQQESVDNFVKFAEAYNKKIRVNKLINEINELAKEVGKLDLKVQ